MINFSFNDPIVTNDRKLWPFKVICEVSHAQITSNLSKTNFRYVFNFPHCLKIFRTKKYLPLRSVVRAFVD